MLKLFTVVRSLFSYAVLFIYDQVTRFAPLGQSIIQK